MKGKLNVFKYTFFVLSIMCCILLVSLGTIFSVEALGTSSIYKTEASSNSDSDSTASASTVSVTAIADTGSKPSAISPSEISQKDAETTPAAVQVKKITIAAVGDIMMHQGNLNNAYNPKTGIYDFSGSLEYITPLISKADLAIANFETVTAGPDSNYTSFPRFNTPDALLSALSKAGFDVLSTANNHCLDRGISGLTRTIQKIKENKMTNIGSSVDGSNKYTTKEVNGIKVSLLSYSFAFNGNDTNISSQARSKYLSPINEAQIKKDIETVKKEGTDAVIVIIHWGTEYQRQPNSYQTGLSNRIFGWGADIILGSHPHVIQKSEIRMINGSKKYIIYSMGNFISGYRRTDTANRPNKVYTEDGVIVNIQIEKDSSGNTVINEVSHIPTWIDKYYVNDRPVYKIIPITGKNPSGKYINDRNLPYVKQSYQNTMGLMAK